MILLLSGKQGSGKTSIAKTLFHKRNDAGHATMIVNFEDVLRDMHDKVLDILHDFWPDRGLAKDGPLLQMLGTDWARNTIDQDIWVKILQTRVAKFSADTLVIVGDCRFPNEFQAFPSALRVRLECERNVRKARCEMWRTHELHPSEIGLDGEAHAGLFDLYLHTDVTDLPGCVALLSVALEKKDWILRFSRRKT